MTKRIVRVIYDLSNDCYESDIASFSNMFFTIIIEMLGSKSALGVMIFKVET